MNKSTINRSNPFKICFVCLGNICRSPTAEGIFQHLVNERNLEPFFYIDSAGTSAYHLGEPANSKSQMTANKHGIKLNSKARRFDSSDFEEFDLILAMDQENFRNMDRLDTDNRYQEKIRMMRDFDPNPGNGDVPDPYYGGIDGFEKVFNILHRSCENLLDKLETKIES